MCFDYVEMFVYAFFLCIKMMMYLRKNFDLIDLNELRILVIFFLIDRLKSFSGDAIE